MLFRIDLFPAEAHGTNVDHICIAVEAFDHAEVVAALPGSHFDDHLFRAQGYANSVYVQDPDGNVIELRRYLTEQYGLQNLAAEIDDRVTLLLADLQSHPFIHSNKKRNCHGYFRSGKRALHRGRRRRMR
jgi:hypothetical protein